MGDGDTGPNTGGMGAYSPAPVLSEAVAKGAHERDREAHHGGAWQRRRAPYQGVLYAGLMIKDGASPGWWNTTCASAIPNARC